MFKTRIEYAAALATFLMSLVLLIPKMFKMVSRNLSPSNGYIGSMLIKATLTKTIESQNSDRNKMVGNSLDKNGSFGV